MFEHSRRLLEEYYALRLSQGITTRAEHLLHEVRIRLRALDWLYERLMDLNQQLENETRERDPEGPRDDTSYFAVITNRARPTPPHFEEAETSFSNADELRILLEAFYYSAHRVRDIFRKNGSDLPGVSFEAVGVRNARNHLVEHPTGQSGVPVYTVMAGGNGGPRLRPLQWSEDPPGTQDQGLRHNSEEFRGSLERVLSGAIGGSG